MLTALKLFYGKPLNKTTCRPSSVWAIFMPAAMEWSRIFERPHVGTNERLSLAMWNHNLLLAAFLPPVPEFPAIYGSQRNGSCAQRSKATPPQNTISRPIMRQVEV